MFDLDRLKTECSAAVTERAALPAVREIVARAVEDPNPVLRALGQPNRSAVQTLLRWRFLRGAAQGWDPERLVEQPYDVQKTLQMFEESNRLYPPS